MANEYAENTTLRSPLGRVRGLGSAKGGTHHWWMQRVTSAALLPLTLWFALSAASLAGAPYEETRAWIAPSGQRGAAAGLDRPRLPPHGGRHAGDH